MPNFAAGRASHLLPIRAVFRAKGDDSPFLALRQIHAVSLRECGLLQIEKQAKRHLTAGVAGPVEGVEG